MIVILLIWTRLLRENLWRWKYLSRYVWLIAAGILLLGVGREAIHDARDFQFHNCWLAEGNPVVKVKLAERAVNRARAAEKRAGEHWGNTDKFLLERLVSNLDEARRELSEARIANQETTLWECAPYSSPYRNYDELDRPRISCDYEERRPQHVDSRPATTSLWRCETIRDST